MNRIKTKDNSLEFRVVYLDCLRIFASFFVILLHVAGYNWSRVGYSFEWKVFNVYESISRWPVPVFVMISGALFLNPQKEFSTKEVFCKYIWRMIKVFCIWSLFYTFLRLVRIGKAPAIEVVKYFIRGHYHLWFLYLVSSLYLLVPVLRCVTSNEKVTEYFLFVGFFVIFLFPRISDFCSQFNTYGIEKISSFIQYIFGNTSFSQKTCYYIYYYILGYYLHMKEIKEKYVTLIYWVGLLGCISTIALTEWHSLRNQMASTHYYTPEALNIFFMSIAVFLFAKHKVPQQMIHSHKYNFIQSIAQCSFTIYLVHAFVLDTLGSVFGFTSFSFNPVFSIPILSVCIFIISYILSLVIKRLSCMFRPNHFRI